MGPESVTPSDRAAITWVASSYPAVGVVAYDRSWPARYLQLSEDLQTVLGGDWVIEHIGSTSVPGLVAKPVIDLALRVPPGLDLHDKTIQLVAAGWTTPASIGTHECSFVLDGTVRSAIAHFFSAAQWPTAHQRLFADWLRTHPDDRDAYACLKQQLQQDNIWGTDYTRAKTDFVQTIVD